MPDSYLTFTSSSEGIFRDKGSRFLGFAHPVDGEVQCKSLIASVRKEHPKARHVCHAFRVGVDSVTERSNDDSEPSGTAGKPILGQLHSNQLNNALILVVRYFGGTLLGVPGLIHAYKSAAAEAISNNKVVEKQVQSIFQLDFNYASYHLVMSLLNKEPVIFMEQKMDKECKLVVSIDHCRNRWLVENLGNFENIRYQ